MPLHQIFPFFSWLSLKSRDCSQGLTAALPCACFSDESEELRGPPVPGWQAWEDEGVKSETSCAMPSLCNAFLVQLLNSGKRILNLGECFRLECSLFDACYLCELSTRTSSLHVSKRTLFQTVLILPEMLPIPVLSWIDSIWIHRFCVNVTTFSNAARVHITLCVSCLWKYVCLAGWQDEARAQILVDAEAPDPQGPRGLSSHYQNDIARLVQEEHQATSSKICTRMTVLSETPLRPGERIWKGLL